MIRNATIRLPVAVLITATGALVSILWGRADAALLTAPWVVLLVVGLSGSRTQEITGSLACDTTRVVSGDSVRVLTTITGASGRLLATCRPAPGFRDSSARADYTVEIDNKSNDESNEEVVSLVDVARPGRATDLVFSVRTSTWGNHDLGRVDLEVTEPYGLLRWSGSLHIPSPVRVHPRPIDLQHLLTPWHVRRLSGAHRSRATGRGVEYADVRPFASGDSLRDVNWRASARSDELWVSQRHPERSTDVVLLLDTFVESGHDLATSLGFAIEAAIALSESHLSVSDRVGLVELGGIMRWVTPGAGRYQLQRLVDALLATTLYENASDRYVLSVPPRALPPRSFVVALSPLLDDRFIDSLGVLRAAGHDVSVIECPPFHTLGSTEPHGTDRKEPDQPEMSDTARVAWRLWALERAMMTDRLAELGVATGRWHHGDSVNSALAELAAHRRGMRAGAGLGAGRG